MGFQPSTVVLWMLEYDVRFGIAESSCHWMKVHMNTNQSHMYALYAIKFENQHDPQTSGQII